MALQLVVLVGWTAAPRVESTVEKLVVLTAGRLAVCWAAGSVGSRAVEKAVRMADVLVAS